MDDDGMVYASNSNQRIRVAATTAKTTESSHYLRADFLGFG